MHAIWFIGFIFICTFSVITSLNQCADLSDKNYSECNQTEYNDYRTCIEKNKKERLKRESACSEACAAQINKCVNECLESDSCIKVCRAMQCDVQQDGFHTVVIDNNDNNDPTTIESPFLGTVANITTVIKLTNIVNNTNVVNVPTNINSTNINNIHIITNTSSTEGGQFGMGYTKEGDCCFAVRPKTCLPSTSGIRCHHKRHKTCGKQCTSRIIHVQLKKHCSEDGCEPKIDYVPQPGNPKCISTNQWPYVSCGGNYQKNCDGCYDQYNYMNGGTSEHCRGCYNDGFDYGQLYRPGPAFTQNYYNQPPCYLTGTCPMPYYPYSYPDQSWNYQANYDSPQYQSNQYNNNNNNNQQYIEETEADDEGSFSDYEIGPFFDDKFEYDDGIVPIEKCQVISDDNTITIQNCTHKFNNAYAASPDQQTADNENNIYDPYSGVRKSRSNNNNPNMDYNRNVQMLPPQNYYYPVPMAMPMPMPMPIPVPIPYYGYQMPPMYNNYPYYNPQYANRHAFATNYESNNKIDNNNQNFNNNEFGYDDDYIVTD